MHHLCLEVQDLDAKLQQLRDRGVELINETGRANVKAGATLLFIPSVAAVSCWNYMRVANMRILPHSSSVFPAINF